MIIAIDGTTASGKSTVAKKLAEKLGFLHVNTGLMYRGVAAYTRQKNIDTADVSAVTKLIENIDVKLCRDEKNMQHIYINEKDYTDLALAPDIGIYVSNIADNASVRKKLVAEQRRIGLEAKNAVLEGRDIATIVFPNADLKLFITADLKVRAKRRYLDDIKRNPNITLEDCEKYVAERDFRDFNREIAPLIKTPDAVLIDNSNMNLEQTLTYILTFVKI